MNAISITDDHQWIVSGFQNGEVIVYLFDGTKYYDPKQTLHPDSRPVVSVSLTNDHQFLAVGYDGKEVFTYQFVSSSFSPLHTLFFNSSTQRKAQLSDDHQKLLITHANGLLEIYHFDGA